MTGANWRGLTWWMASGWALLLLACAQSPAAKRGPVVMAAASLQGPLDELAARWHEAGHEMPVIAYAGTPVHARQISNGAPADIAFFADEAWMDTLEASGQIDPGSRRSFLGNRLAIAAQMKPGETDGSAELTGLLGDLGNERLAIADPETVPAGRYGRQALETLGLWSAVKDRIVPTQNVRAALALVERGEVPLALVYESDLTASSALRRAARIPDHTQPPIRYPIAILKTSRHPQAQGFADFLASPAARAVFSRYRFTILAER